MSDLADRLLATRSEAYRDAEPNDAEGNARAEEGGCGVTGFACNIPVRGKFIHEPSIQMQNRGNGKGGGIAAAGLVPEQIGVSREVLDSHYLLQIALLAFSKSTSRTRRLPSSTKRTRRGWPTSGASAATSFPDAPPASSVELPPAPPRAVSEASACGCEVFPP